ncbi:DNA mismatch repair protein MutS [Leptolyngbya sp. FACHB-261]|uniref:DNA mismatch repair protein MutS n=1 Tax=Leptolyngbya sp. FACHB-261 TaxID=2692806 RepID=UPI001681F7C8|nr:DNA mismatch repair protein MutS [Leptolyngbya sp. FACHB-261]MBD2099982.1 DNA mismatch repair protein MutS [Leptolyngbya sp. FACHB-261]
MSDSTSPSISHAPPSSAPKNHDYRAVERADLTPMMQHYIAMKELHPQAILLYRMGDFYETFFQDAALLSRELEIVLTGRESGKKIGRVPMAGIPHHALDRYCTQLVEKGYAVAICDQMEDPAAAQGLVKREVTRVITPGTVLEEGMLNARKNNFLVAMVPSGKHWGLAYADVSTGEFYTTQLESTEQLTQELLRLGPSEILLPVDEPDLVGLLRPGEGAGQLPEGLPRQFCYTLRPQRPFALTEARSRILEAFGVRSLEGYGCEHLPLAVRASGGLLEYLSDTQKSTKLPLQRLSTYTVSAYLSLDPQTRRNLELTQTVRDGTFHGSLLWALDRTRTSMGGRLLRRWLLQPLLNAEEIRQRQATIQELVDDGHLRTDLQTLLDSIYDLERLAGRAGSGTANARDLIALATSLGKLPEVTACVSKAHSPLLKPLQQVPPDLEQLGQKLKRTLVATPPLHLTEGNLIREGVDTQLDSLRAAVEGDVEWIKNLEETEKVRTGINTLKVGYNSTFGYYISISRARSAQAPDEYIRKQTLVNEERYITPELKERETRILTTQRELQTLEYEIFSNLRTEVGQQVTAIREVATGLSTADVLAGLAEQAVYRSYCCPQIREDRTLAIEAGRHPVVEQSLPAGFFVPNSVHLGVEHPDLMVLTGPNMSGKSTFLRQTGLIQLMAQIGSFVPADQATLGLCDRIFTRVGAVDDLATGQSTFMVEMNETANILNHATPRSLVLLDEIGRGTATFDGLSIAWAVAEHLASQIGCRTVFATHYHELNELASLLPNVANFQVTVKELEDEIVFLHSVQPGGADRSYGIEVGRLAGLPASVINRAKQVMAQIDANSTIVVGLRSCNERPRKPAAKPKDQLSIFEAQLD